MAQKFGSLRCLLCQSLEDPHREGIREMLLETVKESGLKHQEYRWELFFLPFLSQYTDTRE